MICPAAPETRFYARARRCNGEPRRRRCPPCSARASIRTGWSPWRCSNSPLQLYRVVRWSALRAERHVWRDRSCGRDRSALFPPSRRCLPRAAPTQRDLRDEQDRDHGDRQDQLGCPGRCSSSPPRWTSQWRARAPAASTLLRRHRRSRRSSASGRDRSLMPGNWRGQGSRHLADQHGAEDRDADHAAALAQEHAGRGRHADLPDRATRSARPC